MVQLFVRSPDGPAVEAVDHGAQAALGARRQAELRDVGDPQLVGAARAEAVRAVRHQRQVGGRRRRLAGVAAPRAPASAPARHQALLAHDAPHDLLRDARAAPPELGPHRPVAARAAERLEDLADHGPEGGVPIGPQPGAVVLVGAVFDSL